MTGAATRSEASELPTPAVELSGPNLLNPSRGLLEFLPFLCLERRGGGLC